MSTILYARRYEVQTQINCSADSRDFASASFTNISRRQQQQQLHNVLSATHTHTQNEKKRRPESCDQFVNIDPKRKAAQNA